MFAVRSRPRGFCEEPQCKIAILLKEHILTAVAPVCLGVGKMLSSVQFDGNPRLGVKKVHFHPPPSVERNRQLNVQVVPAGRVSERFKAAV